MNPNQSQPVVLHPKQPNNNNNSSHKNLSAYPSAPPLGGQQQKPYRKKPFNPNSNYGYQNGGGGSYHGSGGYSNYPRSMAPKDSYYKATKSRFHPVRTFHMIKLTPVQSY